MKSFSILIEFENAFKPKEVKLLKQIVKYNQRHKLLRQAQMQQM